MSVRMRQRVEKMIARRVILDGLKAGFAFNVNNGGDENELPANSTNVKEILAAMFATDDEYLLFYKPGENRRIGWVRFVYGNGGWDVISDYTTNLTKFIESGAVATIVDKYSD